MKSVISTVLIVTLFMPTLAMAASVLNPKKAAYIGGSTKDRNFPNVKKEVIGRLNTGDNQLLMFFPDKKKLSVYTIPYSQIIAIEYGHEVGRLADNMSTMEKLSLSGLLLSRIKIPRHYVTIGYIDNDDQIQVAVFELGINIIRIKLPILIVRSGIEITYQDEEAKKQAGAK